jgi:hypothetical protein
MISISFTHEFIMIFTSFKISSIFLLFCLHLIFGIIQKEQLLSHHSDIFKNSYQKSAFKYALTSSHFQTNAFLFI